ncbi:fatty-acyl-CoA synthase [Neomicrococcus aestuarii]|uniref:Fatty-acyl-CoA synthase n=1 Tax=Neomicrococcus aestuarii TaxID=556325 RepID=A0A7W8X054_9MICC|nr:long-chain fatty acid--CoA ligase [Neomicrococcus aestuarii]MBB5513005.1 fatty-acyl-CoA synthase [Neomicrococcus aestuarii]
MTRINISAVAGIQRQVQFFPNNEVLVYGDRTWNYRELNEEVSALTRSLVAHGIQRGDRVAYLGLNSVTFIETMLAAWWIGAIFEPLNFRLAPREVEGLLGQSDPKVLIVEQCHVDVVNQVIEQNEYDFSKTTLVLVDNDPEVPPVEGAATQAYQLLRNLVAQGAEAELPEPVEQFDDDLAILMFTSGTTGKPKGVQLTHGNVWWNSVNVDSLVDTRRGDTNLAVAPMFHIGGLNALTIRSLVRGGRTIIRRSFDPRQVLADIEKFGVEQAFLVPAMLSAMQQTADFETANIGSLRALICAGAPVPPILISQYEHKGVPVQQAWGLTETAPFATYLPTELTYAKPGSCGLPMPYCEVKIVDPATGEEVQNPGDTGEMWVKGPNVTSGYWNNPQATEAAFFDGWFRSGDIGYRDEAGYLFIVDRLKDMIITGGENVYPAEVERALMEYPGVVDVAVVGRSDPKWGESVVAVMSFKTAEAPSIEEIRAFADQYLARYKLPKELVIATSVPRNGSGKLDKVAVRQLIAEEGDR